MRTQTFSDQTSIWWKHHGTYLTPNNRPQMATVRYKVMNAPERTEETHGEIISCAIDKEKIKAHWMY